MTTLLETTALFFEPWHCRGVWNDINQRELWVLLFLVAFETVIH